MGIKQFRQIIAYTCLTLLTTPLQVNAASVDELYSLYGIKYNATLDGTVSETIKGYNNAKRYVEMYHHVSTAEFDTSVIDAELKHIDSRLKEIKEELFAGFYLTLDDIYLLEDEYNSLVDRKEELCQVDTDVTLDYQVPNLDTVPAYADYKEALKIRNEFEAQKEIGLLEGLEYPLQASSIMYDVNTLFTTFKTIDNTGVLCLFNGRVEKVEDTRDGLQITIDHYNGVRSIYNYLEETSLRTGDTVYQNQSIGYLLGNKLTLQLQLNGEFVDVSKLYNKE